MQTLRQNSMELQSISTMNIASRKGELRYITIMVEAGGTNFVNSITSVKQCNNQDIVDYYKMILFERTHIS